MYNVACCYALCVPAVVVGKGPDPLRDEDRALQSRYASRAVDSRRAGTIAAGIKDLDNLEKDPDLAPIREHPGYKELVERVKSAAPASKPKPDDVKGDP